MLTKQGALNVEMNEQFLDEGAITEEEYNRVKNDLLKRI